VYDAEEFEAALAVVAHDAAAVDDEGRFPRAGIEALRRAGVLGLTVPVELGGTGPDPVAFSEVTSRLAATCGSTAMVFLMHACASAVVAAAPPSSRPGLPADLARGAVLGTLAFSERGSRSHFWAPVSASVREDDGVRIKAAKSWVTSAGEADVYVVSCLAPEASSPTDTDLYVLDAATDGLEVEGPWVGLGLRGNASSPMAVESTVDEGLLLGEHGGGFGLMMSAVLPWFSLGNACVSVGLARGALDAAVAHASGARFEHLGSSLSDLPTIRASLARAEVTLRAAEALVRETARSIAAPDEGTMAAVLAVKAAGNETALTVTDAAMRVCGGAAFSRHLPIERAFRDARAGHVMAPTADVLYEFLGRSMCGLDLF
jgi:alkylation response protein AidB-like acyl-CoA dehydrogenase